MDMIGRFTDRARKVFALANQEAIRFNHEYIGTEHVLLGLIKEGRGVAANVLKELNVDLSKVELQVERLVKIGRDIVLVDKLPQTPRLRRAIEFAIEESHSLGHNYVGTEHLLLGLIRETDAAAGQVLMNLGLKLEEVREEVIELLGRGEQVKGQTKLGHKPNKDLRGRGVVYSQVMSRVIGFAVAAKEEAKQPYVGTGHVLIGLLREKDSVAARVLAKIGLTEEMVKLELTSNEL